MILHTALRRSTPVFKIGRDFDRKAGHAAAASKNWGNGTLAVWVHSRERDAFPPLSGFAGQANRG
jgi:hypothetical protein